MGVPVDVVEIASLPKKQMSSDVVEVINPAGSGGFVLVCEHASSHIPCELKDLGLSGDVLTSHVAWDPGALAVAEAMSGELDAPLVAQRVSRLVYDCNRPPQAASATPARSEIYAIPGNAGLSPAERERRAERYYVPFRETLAACIDARLGRPAAPVVVTIHSFTPVYFGLRRSVDIGILHDADRRLADAMLECAKSEPRSRFRRNEPYGPLDGVTHTLVEQAMPRGLMNVMIEIRNDLIGSEAEQQEMAALLCRLLRGAMDGLTEADRMTEKGADPCKRP